MAQWAETLCFNRFTSVKKRVHYLGVLEQDNESLSSSQGFSLKLFLWTHLAEKVKNEMRISSQGSIKSHIYTDLIAVRVLSLSLHNNQSTILNVQNTTSHNSDRLFLLCFHHFHYGPGLVDKQVWIAESIMYPLCVTIHFFYCDIKHEL